MSKMNSPFKYLYDAAPEAALMVRGAGAQTANFSGTPIVLDVLNGYWNPAPAGLADQTLAVVVNVLTLNASLRTATMTFTTVVNTDTFTLSDGVSSKVFTAVTAGAVIANGEFNVAGSDTLTAAAAVVAIQYAYTNGLIAISATSALGVITLTNHLGTGGTITEAETTIATTAFAGNNETYLVELEAGPVGFGSSLIFGSLAISKPGQYVILLDMDTVKAIKPDTAAIRIKGTLAGIAPSLTAYSWIAGIKR